MKYDIAIRALVNAGAEKESLILYLKEYAEEHPQHAESAAAISMTAEREWQQLKDAIKTLENQP